MPENPYARWLKIDFDLCLLDVGRDALNAILEQVIIKVHEAMGVDPKPSTYLDLEQLQRDHPTVLLHSLTEDRRSAVDRPRAGEVPRLDATDHVCALVEILHSGHAHYGKSTLQFSQILLGENLVRWSRTPGHDSGI
jgi:hypothetical protein